MRDFGQETLWMQAGRSSVQIYWKVRLEFVLIELCLHDNTALQFTRLKKLKCALKKELTHS